jgi:hypothetical protein
MGAFMPEQRARFADRLALVFDLFPRMKERRGGARELVPELRLDPSSSRDVCGFVRQAKHSLRRIVSGA